MKANLNPVWHEKFVLWVPSLQYMNKDSSLF
jgi:hypothetical protein